jgi:hypothetical protein
MNLRFKFAPLTLPKGVFHRFKESLVKVKQNSETSGFCFLYHNDATITFGCLLVFSNHKIVTIPFIFGPFCTTKMKSMRR